MLSYETIKNDIAKNPRVWLVTGVAGFIGSGLLEALLMLKQRVIGLDNFSTGYKRNLEEVRNLVGEVAWKNFTFIEGDICKLDDCYRCCKGVDFVLHHAALGSVPRSLENPIETNRINIDGFLNILVAARDCMVERVIYAASSSTYGDNTNLPKIEENIGRPLSPYAITKYVNELYAQVFSEAYKMQLIGLRYFNVFGRRQSPNGAYAAVIPKWIAAIIAGDAVVINGDGETSRDFCYIDNVIQANIMAATVSSNKVYSLRTQNQSKFTQDTSQIFNVAVGNRTTLNELYNILVNELSRYNLNKKIPLPPTYCDFRPGDVRHSLADINKAKKHIGYVPTHDLISGVKEAMPWYVSYFGSK